ncbi:NUDIX hydrolase [Sphingomonas immobilis]|uniref:NUDIX domain-containing protein n=1 Tax=Sphingomonas immobilis TaxID=3063997 RepID=A0ABT9A1F4_9SPHN|nr:NUDIX domain-containing protein [Sphingomonas sp. CA1-15]MDO7843653.1 NUDIX domain-containing protein [Sphingomonas sp. CA1-15]
MSNSREVIPAATLVLFRARDGAAPQLLMVERAKAMSFAAGATVFPGGRVDAGDRALAATFAGDQDIIAGAIAAIRETIEEAGMPVGLIPAPHIAALTALRQALHGGTAFGKALHDGGFAIDPALLVPFARWLPPAGAAHRVFDTRFYLAEVPPGAPEPVVDDTENVSVFWASAQEVLDAAEEQRLEIIFPTRRNLERLARFGSFAEACADAAAYPPRTVTSWIEERGGISYVCIPEDLGYPVTSEPAVSAMRS